MHAWVIDVLSGVATAGILAMAHSLMRGVKALRLFLGEMGELRRGAGRFLAAANSLERSATRLERAAAHAARTQLRTEGGMSHG